MGRSQPSCKDEVPEWPGHLAALTGKLSAWAAARMGMSGAFLGRTLSRLDYMVVN
jgi:hypothetical protein